MLVKILAAGFNHRDCWSRQSLYPGLIFSRDEKPSIMGSDAVGLCLTKSHELYNQLVLCAPSVGWHTSKTGPDQPDQPFGILGAVKQVKGRGTFAEYICVGRDDIVKCPHHLTTRGRQGLAEAASLPVAALTAWRAAFVKGEVKAGQNVLITGIGGGVAILAMQLCVAAGANVWVCTMWLILEYYESALTTIVRCLPHPKARYGRQSGSEPKVGSTTTLCPGPKIWLSSFQHLDRI